MPDRTRSSGGADPPTPHPAPDGLLPAESTATCPVDDWWFQQAPCGYLITTDDSTITAVNDFFLHWTGYRREQLVGTPLLGLFPIGDRILYATHCQPLLTMVGTVTEIALEVTGLNGTRRAALLSAARAADVDGMTAPVRVIIFSAHERRRYEKELLAARRAAQQSEAHRAQAEAGLQHLALHDQLTGALNRAGLHSHLQQRFYETPGAAADLALLFIDLDHFKAVNDSLGHAAGDALIAVVADRLRNSIRDTTILARLAGDEFVVVETIADEGDLEVLAQRLLLTINAPVVIEGIEIVPSASIGAARAARDDTAERLLRHADIAMYRAKARGRNTWHLHDPHVADPAVDRLRLIGELRQGIERRELRVHYQPRIDLRTGRIHSAEALVRWQHPTRGLLLPYSFIDIAEESGLIRRLGADVLDQAVAQAANWHATNPDPDARPIEIAVNLSPRQLTDPGMVAVVVEALNRHEVDPALLTLEITETALMADPDAAMTSLVALNALGVMLALDDFGTGYSSLTYLRQFPIQELKIDRSFVAGLGVTVGDTAIVASCIQLAHAVGIRAVAEGVETADQRNALIEMGCDLAQGYLYSRAVSAEMFAGLLRADISLPNLASQPAHQAS